MKVYFATRLRSFFNHLFAAEGLKHQIDYNKSSLYDINGTKSKIINRIGRSSLFDILGVIQVVKPKKGYEIYGSYNRFLKINKPYFIYVENPTALFHYRLNRIKSILGKIKIKKELNNPNLKALVFMSKACADTFNKVCGKPHNNCLLKIIYPFVPPNPYTSTEFILQKNQNPVLNLLFVAQGQRFMSKGGLEIIQAYNYLIANNIKVNLRIITSFKDLDKSTLEYLKNQKQIQIDDFKFSFEEMQRIYASSHILLQPSSDDSSPLTILEAIKSGLPIIGSRLYSIPEMVQEGFNGFLCDPHWWFFDKNNLPNPKVWNHRNKTIYSGRISKDIVEFLIAYITQLYENRELLCKLSLNSLRISSEPPYDCDFIIKQWNELFLNLAQ